jgi:hypothetical protein
MESLRARILLLFWLGVGKFPLRFPVVVDENQWLPAQILSSLSKMIRISVRRYVNGLSGHSVTCAANGLSALDEFERYATRPR